MGDGVVSHLWVGLVLVVDALLEFRDLVAEPSEVEVAGDGDVGGGEEEDDSEEGAGGGGVEEQEGDERRDDLGLVHGVCFLVRWEVSLFLPDEYNTTRAWGQCQVVLHIETMGDEWMLLIFPVLALITRSLYVRGTRMSLLTQSRSTFVSSSRRDAPPFTIADSDFHLDIR